MHLDRLARGHEALVFDGVRQVDRRRRRVDDVAVEPHLAAAPGLHLDAAHLHHGGREALLPQALVRREAVHQHVEVPVDAQLVVGEEEPHAARQQLVVVVVQHVGRARVHGRRDRRRLRRGRRAQRPQLRRVRRVQPCVHLVDAQTVISSLTTRARLMPMTVPSTDVRWECCRSRCG